MKTRKRRRLILIAAGIVLAVYVIGSVCLINYFFNQYFHRREPESFSAYLRWADFDDFDRETVTFPSGKETLTGYIYGKNNTSQGLVVISHGLGGFSEKYISETKYFVDNGFMVFAYDNTGSGASTGDSCRGLAQSAIDLDNALTYVEQNPVFDGLPVCLYGHSWGGYATTAVLNYDHDIAAVISLSGYNSCMQEMTYVGKSILGAFVYAEYPFMWMMQYLTFGDKVNVTAVDGINHAEDTAVLIVQGDLDDFVGYDGPCIYANRDKITSPNVQFVVLENRDHGDLMMDQSEERLNYIEKMNEEYDMLSKSYDGDIPDEINEQWYAALDKNLNSKLDEELFAGFVEFYLQAIEK
ncbi:MAG: alpha/beta fold hydrolase [Lachnospiraceae bacterium]|nr:alpha/beta fold hydrolase [Lachnospiraceae bacterium]